MLAQITTWMIPCMLKLLYVGCTRALHQLILTFDQSLSPLIEKVIPDLYQVATSSK
jgi:hypothetical protein